MSRNFYGIITNNRRWNLNTEKWEEPTSDKEMRKSLGIIKFPIINKNKNEGINLVILIDGSRIEDHSKKGLTISPKQSGISKIRKYFLKNNVSNISLQSIYMDKDAPINEESKFLAEYVDKCAQKENIKSISLIGHSKGATLIFNSAKFLKKDISFKKLNIYTVSCPFLGTMFASPRLIYYRIQELFPEKIAKFVIKFYESISSNSHMDYDIGVLDEVYDDMKPLYDRSFIENMLSTENINAVLKVHAYQNIVTLIDKSTLKYVLLELNPIALGMCILNKLVFPKEKSDGFVPLRSQLAIAAKSDCELNSIILPGSQHHFLCSNRLVGMVFKLVKNNL